MTKEVLKLALEALEFDGFVPEDAQHRAIHAHAITAIKEALAQPAQEPPSEWAGIKAILDEYGLQAIDFVADWKAAQEYSRSKNT